MITIRRFENGDEKAVAQVIEKTLRTSNSKDYSADYIEENVKSHSAAVILDRASASHFYVACSDGRIVGCGAVAPYWNSPTESILLTIFVLPELQGQGIGRLIIKTLEKDDYFKRAIRVEIPASITACEFYRKLGYDYKNGGKTPDDEGCIRLEKNRIL